MIHLTVQRPLILTVFLALYVCAGCSTQANISKLDLKETPLVENVPIKIPDAPEFNKPKPSKQAGIKNNSIDKTPENAWVRLFNLYALPEYNNSRIDKELNWYLKHRNYLNRIQQRAEPYLYNILEEIEDKHIPGELALLPVIESAFLPHAHSRSQAAGLWQFIPATGRMYGLKQNWWYDGRRDIYASTQAATTYLRELADLYEGDWLLALAAYNAGKGRVSKAIKVNQQHHLATDYWSLKLPRETMSYVPKLLAVTKIFANAKRYHLKLHPIANTPVFQAIDIGSQLDLSKAAEMANTPLNDFFKLNPGFIRWCTAPDGPHRLLIPVNKAVLFKQNLARLPAKERMQWLRHRIKPGDCLGSIAKKYKTSVTAIRQVNHLANNQIRAGRYLLIPASHKRVKHYAFKQNSYRPKEQHFFYTVKSGDTFWDIARKFSVSSKNIAVWNKLRLSSILHPGQKLLIKTNYRRSVVALSSQRNSLRFLNYKVKKGDSLFDISRKFRVSLTDLYKWNAITQKQYLQPGQHLKVRVVDNLPAT